MDNYQQELVDNMGNQYWRKKIQLKEARERGFADALTEQAEAAVSESVASTLKGILKGGKFAGKALFSTLARLGAPFFTQDVGSVMAANLERGDSVTGTLARIPEVKAYYEFNEQIYNQRPEIQEFVQAIIDFAATQGETLTVEDVLRLVAQGEYGIQGSYTNSILRLYNLAQAAARGDYPEENPFRTIDASTREGASNTYRTPKGGVGGPDDYPGFPGGPPLPQP